MVLQCAAAAAAAHAVAVTVMTSAAAARVDVAREAWEVEKVIGVIAKGEAGRCLDENSWHIFTSCNRQPSHDITGARMPLSSLCIAGNCGCVGRHCSGGVICSAENIRG